MRHPATDRATPAMLIVKPYGRSDAAFDKKDALHRQLRLRPKESGPHDIGEFAASHPELLVAQWISTIDRIARKPAGRNLPTPQQRRLREILGAAAWSVLQDDVLNGRMADGLDKLWRRKVHPYGDKDDNSSHGRERGRWYIRFAGDLKPDQIGTTEALEIAHSIKEHLHEREYRIGGRLNKRQGRIAARAESIAGNVARPLRKRPEAGWTAADLELYRAAGDAAAAIRHAAEELEAKDRRVGPAVAAKALQAHYAQLFVGEDGEPLSISGAKERKPGLFALHMAVRETYRRILKDHGKDRKEHGARRRKISTLLPEDMGVLFALVDAMGRNRDLAVLVRLGKLVHYTAALNRNGPAFAGDEPAYAIDCWPSEDEIDGSRYRTSAGQAEIKRNEAFARIWRGVVALAQRTLTDWADPDGRIDKDIFLSGSLEKAVEENFFDSDACDAKLRLLFGSRASLFPKTDLRVVLRLALEGWAGLRNGSFHFVGRGDFARVLRRVLEGSNIPDAEEALQAVGELLKADLAERSARLAASLSAAHVGHYYKEEQIAALLAAVADGAQASAPLPRFRRILDRAENAWRRGSFRFDLPDPDNRRTMEANPGRLARYIALKTLYERAFPAWLETQDAGALNGWIERAAARATEAARSINKDPEAAARSAGLIELKDGDGVADFADRLAALTATEYRVQRGYRSAPDAARQQAKHLEDLRCDVIAQALHAYLTDAGFVWTLDDPDEGPLPETGKADLHKIMPSQYTDFQEEDTEWLARLYFLIHLVPVEAVSGLRHQLRKCAVLEPAPDPDVAAVERLFGLYLDMHDAKFEGGEGVAGVEALRELFVSEAVFRRVCPKTGDAGSHVPWRGLREMLRFGGGEPRLMPVFRTQPIDTVIVDELEKLEAEPIGGGLSPVATAHDRRERLHAAWVKRKRLSCEEKDAYREALKTVIRHRHLAGHVRLDNHARLHRLAMAVLGRLADYAGLWERDLYLVALALVRLRGVQTKEVFSEKELAELKRGRIVIALREDRSKDATPESGSKKAIKQDLKRLFGKDFLANDDAAGIRNGFAHFNMLRAGTNEVFDLTAAVNDARRLMAYDRKLKNAVSRSIVELLARENLDLAWEMKDHRLAGAVVQSRQAAHLGGREITEDLHGPAFVAMVAAMFGGKTANADGASEAAAGDGRGASKPESGSLRGRVPETPPYPALATGQRVGAVLLEEKTRKGGWKAKTIEGGVVGDVYNSGDVPPDAVPGLDVELVVRVANPTNASFEWPSPQVEERLAKRKSRRRGERPGGRWR